MEIYDFRQAVTDDVKDYLKQLDVGTFAMLVQDYQDTIQDIEDRMFISDSVTGNGSGSYTFSTMKAERNLVGNWSLLQEARDELCPDTDLIKKGAEYCDVLIRCYLLPESLTKALNDLLKEKYKGED